MDINKPDMEIFLFHRSPRLKKESLVTSYNLLMRVCTRWRPGVCVLLIGVVFCLGLCVVSRLPHLYNIVTAKGCFLYMYRKNKFA